MATIFTFGKTQILPVSAPKPRRDWNNQELSDLYRAIASLSQAGILVEMERGLTDEGDPWLVLCRLDGDVFIHFCRLEGCYLLDSPALAAPLRGHNFAQLIDLFIAQAAMAAAPNVVAFRASKVFLHPAALITILVWSLYVWSSDTTQAGETSDADLHFGQPDASLLTPLPDAMPQAGKPATMIDGVSADRLLGRLQQAIEHTTSFSAANNVAAMQMLAVVGTLVLSAVSATALNAEGEAIEVSHTDVALPALGPEHATDVVDFSASVSQSAWDHSDSAALLVAAATPGELLTIAEPTDDSVVQTVHIAEAKIAVGPTVSDAPVLVEPQQQTIVVTPAAAVSELHTTSIVLPSATLAQDFGALLNTGLTLARYDIGGVSLLASFDPTSLDALRIVGETDTSGVIDLQFDAPQLAAPPQAVLDGSYNDAARAFINAFLDQSDQIQIIASATQLVLIDLSAFDDVNDRACAYSWTLQDGGTISTLGHVEIFASYHLA